MTHTLAAALGLIAMITTLIVGWLSGGGIDQILFRAWLVLLGYSVLDALVGQAANFIVDDSVRRRIADELAQAEAARSKVAEAKRAG